MNDNIIFHISRAPCLCTTIISGIWCWDEPHDTHLNIQVHICRCNRLSPLVGSKCHSCSHGVGMVMSEGRALPPWEQFHRTCLWSPLDTCMHSHSHHPHMLPHSAINRCLSAEECGLAVVSRSWTFCQQRWAHLNPCLVTIFCHGYNNRTMGRIIKWCLYIFLSVLGNYNP